MRKSIEFIEKVVCEGEFINAEELHTKNRHEPYNTTRQIIMTLAIENGFVFTEIGKYFGRDHSTVTAARRSVYNRIDTEKAFNNKFSHYKDICKAGEIITIEFLASELGRLKKETAELMEQLKNVKL